jgi:apolipoprotein N-acyltransferase
MTTRLIGLRPAIGLAAGIATVFAFAPFSAPGAGVVALATLFALWQRATAREAAAIGFAFGIGLFGAGVSWLYIAMHTFGDMPAVLAAIATAGLCAFLALYPALAGWAATRWTPPRSFARAIAAAAAWTLAEWLRSVVFTGFPWLSLGYSQIPDGAPTALAFLAPLGGVFLVTLACALAASLAALAFDALVRERTRSALALALAALVPWPVGVALSRIDWTHPVGQPLAVTLIQGNVLQHLKFDPAFRERTFELYTDLVRQARGRLIVLPESAFPMFVDEVPEPVLARLALAARGRGGDLLLGVFTLDAALDGASGPRYYNSVITLGVSDAQRYRKRHLVPFGETIPLDPVIGWFIRSVLAIPLASQSAGDADQPPFAVAGQRVAVNICYEDAFGSDIRPQAANATLLVNVTNDAWYGRSVAAEQHNQIAAMRALESGRPLLRATNTGITSAIDHRGREFGRLPWFTRAALDVRIAGREGLTPYVRFGDAVAIAAALAGWLAALAHARLRRADTLRNPPE